MGRGFEGGTPFMQCLTRAFSPPKLRPSGGFRFNGAFWSQALTKSACMLDAGPEESVTSPGVPRGIGKVTFMVSDGTGTGRDRGHRSLPLTSLL